MASWACLEVSVWSISAPSMLLGTAVFSVLGFMAKQLDLEINQVVQSGTGLAFIAYPGCIHLLELFWLKNLQKRWVECPCPLSGKKPFLFTDQLFRSTLFFSMLFILGISSQFGLAEVMITALYDQCPSLRKHKSYLAIAVCFVLFCLGLIMTTRVGY